MMKIEIVEINASPSLQFWSKAQESPFVAFYVGNASTAVIFLPGAVDMEISCVWNMEELVGIATPNVAFYDRGAAATDEILPHGQRLKNRPLRHAQLEEHKGFQEPETTYNEEFLLMACTLVLDFKEFLEDQFSSLLNLDLLKRELGLSTAYNQMMVATLDPKEVEAVAIIPSKSLYLEPLFVAFYDGIADTAVIFMSGDEDCLNSSQNSRKKTTHEKQEGPFVAFYDGVVATSHIFLPGATDQLNASSSSPRNKIGLVNKRNRCVASYERDVATISVVMPRCAQRLKHQPLKHVQQVGAGDIEDEFLSLARTMVLDYKEFLEDQFSSLLSLSLLKHELSLSTAYNQTMLATLDPDDLQSLVTIPHNRLYLATLKVNSLPFVAFYDGVVSTAVIFLPGHAKPLQSTTSTSPTPRNSTRKGTEPGRNIIYNNRGSAKARVLRPYSQKDVPTRVDPSKPRPPVRPQWSRTEKCRLLRDKLDGLPLKYMPRTTKYIAFKEKELATRRRILNSIPSLKTVYPGSCPSQSPLTPLYWLEDTYPDMVSATLKDLASQHMTYFRASPSRAPVRQTRRSQIQVIEDLYWEDLRNMAATRIASDIHSKRQQEIFFFNKVQFGSVVEGTGLMSEDKDKSCDRSRNNTKTAQLNYTARLNTNNNGYTREKGDRDVDPAYSSVSGSKSDQGFSRGPDASRNKPRHSYMNKRHSDGHRSRTRKTTGAEGACAEYDQTCVEPEQRKAITAEDTDHLTDLTLEQCHHRDSKLTHIADKRTLSPIKSDPELSPESSAVHKDSTSEHEESQMNTLLQNEVQCEEAFKELFQDISHFKSLCDIPDPMKYKVLQLICTPFINGGYSSGLCALLKLIQNSLSSPGQAMQNQDQYVDQCGSSQGTAKADTRCSIDKEESSPVQMERDLWYRELNNKRHRKCTMIKDNPINDDDFMEDLYFTDNSSDERSESPHSFMHDDFSHDDDILDIPSLSVLSPSHDSLGQAYHGISCPSTLEDDEIKLVSDEPFPSEYVFKRACGPLFNVSSVFWHIKVPTLPSHMVNYQVEQDGLSEIVIGSGSFGEVYAATLTMAPGLSRDVVVKEPFIDKATVDSIVNEAKITMYLESTGCVPICYGLLRNEDGGYGIVMEYVGSGQTLYDIMSESDLPRSIWLNIVCQLASGLNKVHKKDVLINDIKSDNILVDLSGTLPMVKFCDMGTASYKSGVQYKGAMEGCVHLAPEACAHAETTPACDVFSFGRVLKKIHGVSHISALLVVSDKCMAENPADRPTLSTVVQRLQDEYTKEVLFPTLTLTVPSHGYPESSDEESEGESVRVNTPINVDTSSPSSPKVNGDVSSDIEASRDSIRNTKGDEVSPSSTKDPATMMSVEEPDTSSGFVNLINTKHSVSISKNQTLCSHDYVSSYQHTTHSNNMGTSAATSQSAQDGSPSLIDNADTSKSAQDGSPSLINFADTSKSTQDGSPSLIDNADTSKSAQDGSPSLIDNADTSKSAQDGCPSLIDNADTSKSAQDGNPSLIDNADTSKSAQDGSPSLIDNADTSKSAQDGSPSLIDNANTSKSAQDISSSSTGHTIAVATAFHSPIKSPCFYTQTARTESFCTPVTASRCTASHFHTPSASLELNSSDSASCKLQTSSDYFLDAPSEICLDITQDHPAASGNCWIDGGSNEEDDVRVPAAADAILDDSHLSALHVLCQKELDVYNKHYEDTPGYQDYLPLILPLIMVPLGLLGFI